MNDYEEMYCFGMICLNGGLLPQAAELFSGCLGIAQKHFPRSDLRLTMSFLYVGQVKTEEKDYAPAERATRSGLELIEENHELESLQAAVGFYNLARILRSTKRLSESNDCFERSLRLFKNNVPPDHALIGLCLNDFGLLRLAQHAHQQTDTTALFLRQYYLSEAESLITQAIAIARQKDSQIELSNYVANLGRAYLIGGRLDEGRDKISEALAIRRRVLGDTHPKTRQLEHLLSLAASQSRVP